MSFSDYVADRLKRLCEVVFSGNCSKITVNANKKDSNDDELHDALLMIARSRQIVLPDDDEELLKYVLAAQRNRIRTSYRTDLHGIKVGAGNTNVRQTQFIELDNDEYNASELVGSDEFSPESAETAKDNKRIALPHY